MKEDELRTKIKKLWVSLLFVTIFPLIKQHQHFTLRSECAVPFVNTATRSSGAL